MYGPQAMFRVMQEDSGVELRSWSSDGSPDWQKLVCQMFSISYIARIIGIGNFCGCSNPNLCGRYTIVILRKHQVQHHCLFQYLQLFMHIQIKLQDPPEFWNSQIWRPGVIFERCDIWGCLRMWHLSESCKPMYTFYYSKWFT